MQNDKTRREAEIAAVEWLDQTMNLSANLDELDSTEAPFFVSKRAEIGGTGATLEHQPNTAFYVTVGIRNSPPRRVRVRVSQNWSAFTVEDDSYEVLEP